MEVLRYQCPRCAIHFWVELTYDHPEDGGDTCPCCNLDQDLAKARKEVLVKCDETTDTWTDEEQTEFEYVLRRVAELNEKKHAEVGGERWNQVKAKMKEIAERNSTPCDTCDLGFARERCTICIERSFKGLPGKE